MAVNQGGFIFPSKNASETDKNVFCYELAGIGGFIRSIRMVIPQKQTNYSDFIRIIGEQEKKLIDDILNFYLQKFANRCVLRYIKISAQGE